MCFRLAAISLLLLLQGCALRDTDANLPPYDPLPVLFPVQLEHPRNVAGFELRESYDDPDPQIGRTLVYVGPAPAAQRIEVQVRFAGAFVDPAQALHEQWPSVVAQIDALILAEALRVTATHSDRQRSIRSADGLAERQGRSLQLALTDAAGRPQAGVFDLYFVDPYMVSLSSRLNVDVSSADADMQLQKLDHFAAALVAHIKPDPAVLCDPRVQVLKVRSGLSNVSSNGRVIFVSTETDHVDASTVAELQRAASQQRERSGCPPQAQDFSALQAQMRRRARVR